MAHKSSPELSPSPQAPAPADDTSPAKSVVPCANCKVNLNIPHRVARFTCPHCDIDLDVHPPEEEVNEVVIEVEREEGEGGTVTETFTDYRPSRLSIGPPHPDPIVETSSLSAVNPPEPTYDIKIKNKLLRSKALSCLQIETLVYASQRHLQRLQSDVRAGFFIGDGAGVGKGRTIAGLILENWHHQRKKALWISVGSDLKFDARRDLDDVGANNIAVHALNKLPYTKLDSKANGIMEGVIFLTYSSLIASSDRGRSRLQQLVQWFGPGYDGLLIFDECHKAKNLVPEAGSQPTQTGKAVLEIQERLPEARVVYCSATGASEPRNMGYMVRLGLWGEGTSFRDFTAFFRAMDKGGVGALELVAMDMKARGMYVCRTLSYKDAEFEVIEAPLQAPMVEAYKAAAEFWVELRSALSEKSTSSQLWRLYWSHHQKFFRHMCMSAKVPAIVTLAKQALSEGKSVVIGLQSTGEARTEDAVAKYGFELDDFVSGPREMLLKLVDEYYPLPPKPVTPPGDSVKELQRKRHLALPGGSVDGPPGKVAKLNAESDEDLETDSGNETAESDDDFEISGSEEDSESDSENECAEFVDEFQNCRICFSEEEREKLLKCSSCRQLVHSTCLVPPILHAIEGKWSCYSCEGEPNEYVQAAREVASKRFEEALQCKLKLLEKIRSLDLPNNPLDDVIDQLGGPGKVAEITGRKGMFVRTTGGNGVTYQTRNTKDVSREMVNMQEKKLFMDGQKLVAIISEAGSAGVSLQADRRAVNQRRRVHLTLELPWSADRAIQQFGRTHRSNQSSAPEYRLLFSNLGGERRFASAVAKRLESLGALTQGDRRAGPSLSAYNYDSPYGKKALMTMYKGLMGQESLPVLPPGCSAESPNSIQDFIAKAQTALSSVGLSKEPPLTAKGKDAVKIPFRISDSDMYNVERFLNRILGMPPEIQNSLFELFIRILELQIENARFEGLFDKGIVDVKANVIELQGTPKTVHVDHNSGATTKLYTFMVNRGLTWEIVTALLDEKQKDLRRSPNDGFFESKREWMGRRHYILAYEGSAAGMYKVFRPAVGEAVREMPLAELKQKYRKVGAIERAKKGWEHEYSLSSEQCMHGPNCKLSKFCSVGRSLQEVNVLSGVILPVWGAVDKALHAQARLRDRRLRVVRIETTSDGQRIVGLHIPNSAVGSVLQGLVKVVENVKVEYVVVED